MALREHRLRGRYQVNFCEILRVTALESVVTVLVGERGRLLVVVVLV